MVSRIHIHLYLCMVGSLFISCSIYSSSINLDEKIENPNGDEWLAENIEFSEDSTIPKDWWNIFQDENLNVIMNEFLDNNYDLKIALLSLQASKSLSNFNKSSLLPDLSFGLGNSIMQINNKGTQFEDIEISLPNGEIIEFTETDINENHKLNLSSQWEIDLWGKISSNNLSINKTLKAQQNDFDFLKFSLISQAIKIYFNVVELNEQVNLANSSVIANQDVFNIVEERYNKGIGASLLDYRLAKSNLLISQASFEQRKMTLDSYKRQLETLIGRYPAGDILISSSLSNYLPTIPRNLPSNVIQNRPDIVSSYNKIESFQILCRFTHMDLVSGKNNRIIMKFLIARLFFNDGLVTIFALGGIYAAITLDFSFDEVMKLGVVLNISAAIGSFVFGYLMQMQIHGWQSLI